MKKAQGISVNVIIIAAIALLALVVLSVIFIGRMGNWGKTTNSCEANSGKCSEAAFNCGVGAHEKGTRAPLDDYKMHYPLWSCPQDWQDESTGKKYTFCCIKIAP